MYKLTQVRVSHNMRLNYSNFIKISLKKKKTKITKNTHKDEKEEEEEEKS